jgi:hypothetical protein
MSAPMWIQTTALTKREAALMRAWAERLQEASDEGVDLDGLAGFLEVALPVLLELIDEHFPKLRGSRKTELLGKLCREQQRGYLLVNEQAGRA